MQCPEGQFDNMEHSNQSDSSPRFELSEFPFQAMTAATLFDLASGRKCRVLEAGSGPKAPVSSTLAHCENLDLVCCDKMQPESGLDFAEFIVVDLIQTLPFKDESFDFIACTEVLEHLKNPFCVIEELVRVLRPEGFLLLSIPNFWNVRGRLRYFVMANLQKSQFLVEKSRQDFRQNLCPHINTTTLPVYEYGLASLGMKISAACVAVRRPGNWLYWPFALFIMFLSALRSRQKKERYLLDHANHPRILMGGEHIMFVCQKVGFDNVPYEVARWEFLGKPSNI